MTVKDRVGRVRHLAFRVHADPPLSRGEVTDAVRATAAHLLDPGGLEAMRPEVTAYDGKEGLLRVRHTAASEARRVLDSITYAGRDRRAARIESMGTSGTMRAARRKWLTGEAAVRRRPRKGPAKRAPGSPAKGGRGPSGGGANAGPRPSRGRREKGA